MSLFKDVIDEEKLVKGMADTVIPALARAAQGLLNSALVWAGGLALTVTLNRKPEPPKE